MKILISAYACEPNRGSEPGVGWHTVWEVAKYHEVWVLTRPDDGRPAIEEYLAQNPNPNLHFVYFTLPVLGGFWQWGSIAFVLHYYLWQIQAYFVARRLHRQVGFDVSHHVTFVRYSTPSFISLLPIPFVWGPVGGGETAPKPFWRDFSLKSKIYEQLRYVSHKLGELDPFTLITARRSAIARVTTQDTAKRVSYLGASKIETLPAISLSYEEIARLARFTPKSQEHICFISAGRLIHWKGFHLGIRAFARANLAHATYWIIGEGSEQSRLEKLARDLGIAQQVKFWGKLPRAETLSKLKQADVFVHPSLHDSGGLICLEAMAASLPAICLDLGGPSVLVTPDTGIKVPAKNSEQAISDLSQAMICLSEDPVLRSRLGQLGKEKVKKTYNWQTKGQELAKLYEQIAT